MSSLAGAERITLLAPEIMCDYALSLERKTPVDSHTKDASIDPHGISFGSFLSVT